MQTISKRQHEKLRLSFGGSGSQIAAVSSACTRSGNGRRVKCKHRLCSFPSFVPSSCFSIVHAFCVVMFSSSSRSQRSSASTISPFRSRKSPAAPQATKRPVTPTSTVSSRPSLSRILVSPAAPPAASLSHNSGFSSLQPVNQPDSGKSKENVTVTVRFRPLRLLDYMFFPALSYLDSCLTSLT